MIKVFESKKQLVMPVREDVLNLLPHAREFVVKGRHLMAVPHEVESVRLLYNLGIAAPSPIEHYYDWCQSHPFESQRKTAAMLSVHRRGYVLSEMGVGKTRATLYAIDYLMRMGKLNKVLVVAPLSTLVSVWENEIFEVFPHLQATVLYGSKTKRVQLLGVPSDIYIINHDGVKVLQQELIRRPDIDCTVVDELAVYRNSKAERWKALYPLVRRARYAWGLTGSPTPNAPTDAYGQVKLLTPENVSFSFKGFQQETMRQITTFKWLPRPEANDVVKRVMQPSVRYTRDECFDLPPVTYSNRSVEMDPRAAAAYKKMMQELAIQVQNEEIKAANEGVKLSKLLQISSGFVYDREGKAHYVGGIGRIRTVFEIIEQTDDKIILFAAFRYQVELLMRALSRRYSCASIHGGTPKGQRDEAFAGFQKGTSPRVLIAHPATMAHGLTLTAASTIIWFSPVTSLEIYEQANARITRPGQTKHAHVIHIVGAPIEKRVYDRLRTKSKMQGALLDLFKVPQHGGSGSSLPDGRDEV
jgi:SNF2 family DNA or RNA helicase